MRSFDDMLVSLSCLGFTVEHGQFSLTGLPQPLWVHSDEIEVLIEHYSDAIQIEVKFEHHKKLLNYGSEPETVIGMKKHCVTEWFPELEQHFQKVVEYFNLRWRQDGDVEDDVVHFLSYSLVGKFTATETDRVMALVLEIRSVLEG